MHKQVDNPIAKGGCPSNLMKQAQIALHLHDIPLLIVLGPDVLEELLEILDPHVAFAFDEDMPDAADFEAALGAFVLDPGPCAVANQVGEVTAALVEAFFEGFLVDLLELVDDLHEVVVLGAGDEVLFDVFGEVFTCAD